ncbi:MAG TPA: DUF4129 domain-containing protein [Gaiellaceae bacterium]|nr:DUF4129 domain-containing protein [Gaiellaceae bacterium]
MSRRRFIPLAVGVVALLAVVALAARGRPLSTGGGRGSGPGTGYYDYVFTSLLILLAIGIPAVFAALWMLRPDIGPRRTSPMNTVRSLAGMFVIVTALYFIGRHINLAHLFHHHNPAKPAGSGNGTGGIKKPTGVPAQHAQFQWGELVIVLAALVAVGALAYVRRRRLGVRTWGSANVADELAYALDESLDDLRADPDVRRAIVAAYARMEKVLAAAGVPRHPAEAPLEYLERALLSLDTSAVAVRRLTDLFEWARFSQHEPEPAMRDEAVDALVAVRDELRAAEPVAA